MKPPTRRMPNGGCAQWSANWSGHIRGPACLAEGPTGFVHPSDLLPAAAEAVPVLESLLERPLEEVPRRTKVIGRFPGETSCLSMCWAVLDLFLAGARGLGLSDLEHKQVVEMKIARAYPEPATNKVA